MDNRIISIFQEPFTKGNTPKKTQEAKKFREAVIDYHKEYGLYRYPQPKNITLQLKLTVNENNPAQLLNVSKNIIDLLHKAQQDETDKELNRLLFEDDGQIKVLEVSYTIESSPKKVEKDAETRESLENKEAQISKSLGLGSLPKLEHEWEQEIPKMWIISNIEDSFLKLINDLKEDNSYQQLLLSNENFCLLLEEFHKDSNNNGNKFMLQAEALKNNDIQNGELIGLYSKTDMFWKSIKQDIEYGRLGICISGLPSIGNKDKFINEIDDALVELTYNNSYLSPLLIPMSLSIIFMPPKNHGNQNSGKDLDNIARDYIVPAIHKHFSPPSSYLENMKNSPIGVFQEYSSLKTKLFPNGYPKITVMRYQIICIPNTGNYSDDGGIIVLLGDLHNDSILDKIIVLED